MRDQLCIMSGFCLGGGGGGKNENDNGIVHLSRSIFLYLKLADFIGLLWYY